MKNLTLFLLVAVLPTSAFAASFGHDQGNGGDGYSLQFVGVGKKIVQYLKYQKTDLNIDALQEALDSTRVESTTEFLTLNGLPKDALNYPRQKRIVFNRGRWDAISRDEKPALVLHEYLGILGMEDASYKYSKSLIGEFAVANPKSGSSCVITGTEPVLHFEPAHTQRDREYYTIETAVYRGVTFFLKAGHGVARLEAWMGEKRLSNTFYSYGRDPQETDSLRLAVNSASGEEIEAQCGNVDAYLPE